MTRQATAPDKTRHMPYMTLDDLAEILRRRRALIISIIGFGLCVTAMLSLFVAPVYRAEETLAIAPPRVMAELALADRVVPLAAELPRLRDRLLAHDVLDQIATAYELEDVPDLSGAVDMRWDTAAPGVGGIVIRVDLPDPLQAQLVAQELSHRLIGLSAEERIVGAERTLAYLTGEHRALRTAISGLNVPPARQGDPALRDDLARMRTDLAELTQRIDMAGDLHDLEQRRQLERFEVVEPALLPDTPIRDSRPLLALAGGVIGAIVAVAVALLAELRHPALRTAARLQRLTGHAPLAVVPRAAGSDRDAPRVPAWITRIGQAFRRRWPFLI